MRDLPGITFGIIVLNGEPFTRYNLRALYPFAHEIIVVEGASPAAARIASETGHSTDGTLDILGDFKEHEDPDGKLTIVTAEDEGHPDGFWPGEKDEQSQAYARRATGEYLWQVDVDEFYQPDDMQSVLAMLADEPEITAVSFQTITFWGGFDYVTDGWYLRCGAGVYHRLFRWGPGYSYVKHRPPTVQDPGGRDLRATGLVGGNELAKRGILLYHYSLLLPKQVSDKSQYYASAGWARRSQAQQWAEAVYLKLEDPFRVHNMYNYPSWLERYDGEHPPQVQALRRDLEVGGIQMEMRHTADIDQLLGSPSYRLGRSILRSTSPVGHGLRGWRKRRARVARAARRLRHGLGADHS